MGIKGGNRQESGYTLHCRTFHFLSLSFSLRCFRHKTLKYVKFVLKSKTIAFSCKKWPWKKWPLVIFKNVPCYIKNMYWANCQAWSTHARRKSRDFCSIDTKHAKPCRDLHLGELGLIGVVENVWGGFGMVGMFGEGLGMLEDVWVRDIWRSGNCCGSSHLDLDGNIPPPTLFKIRRE